MDNIDGVIYSRPLSKEEDFVERKFQAMDAFSKILEDSSTEYIFRGDVEVLDMNGDTTKVNCDVVEIRPYSINALDSWCKIAFEESEHRLNGRNLLVNSIGGSYTTIYTRDIKGNYKIFITPSSEVSKHEEKQFNEFGLVTGNGYSFFGVNPTQQLATEKLDRAFNTFMMGDLVTKYYSALTEKSAASMRGDWELVRKLLTTMNDIVKAAYRTRSSNAPFHSTLSKNAQKVNES